MILSPVLFDQGPRASTLKPASAHPTPVAAAASEARPTSHAPASARSLPVQASSLYLGDYIRMMAEQAPGLGTDEDYARVYDGDRLVGRIHNSGAATLFGVNAPADWAGDTSGRQGPAEAQRRADQFAALGYKVMRADTAATEDTWRAPTALFDRTAFEAYARAREAAEAQRRT